MIKEQEKYLSLFLLILDILGLIIAYGINAQLSFAIMPLWDFFEPPYPLFTPPILPFYWDRYLSLIPGMMFFWPIFLHLNHGYSPLRIQRKGLIFRLTTVSCLLAGSIFFIFTLLFFHFQANLSFLISFLPLSWALLLLNRLSIASFVKFIQKRGHFIRYLLIAGTDERSIKAAELFNDHPEWGIRVVGFLTDDDRKRDENLAKDQIIGKVQELHSLLNDRVVDTLLFTGQVEKTDQIRNLAYQCELRGIEFSLNTSLLIEKFSDIKVEDIEGISFIHFSSVYQDPQKLFVKRLIDLTVSSLMILLFSPVGLVIAFLIKRDSPGPVFYCQERVGKHGRRFIMYKFRSMIADAEKMQEELEPLDEMDGPAFKIKDDPRITRIGRFLRKTSLDELPQLYNVLRGDMSLVGPRPPIFKEVLAYHPWQKKRLSVKPGITCLWQVSGRNEIGFDEWMRLDIQYIENWSLTLDFKILLRTIPAVLSRKGAR